MQDMVPPLGGGDDSTWAPSTLPTQSMPPVFYPAGFPTHQLDALREGVVLPVLLREALQDLALAFPSP